MKDEGLAQVNKLDLGTQPSLANNIPNKKATLDIENNPKDPFNQLKKFDLVLRCQS